MFLQLMAHYHWQTWCSSCLEVVIISFFFREVGNVPYGHSHPTSSLASSSTVLSWLLIGLLPWMDPGRTGYHLGILEGHSSSQSGHHVPEDDSQVILNSTSLLGAVTTSTYHLSSSVWSCRMMGLINLITDALVGMVERTITSPSGRGFARPGGVCPALSAAGKAIDLTGGVSSSGRGLNINGVVPCAMCLPEFDPVPLMSATVAWVMGALEELLGPGSQFQGQFFPGPRGCLICRRQHASSHFASVPWHSLPKGGSLGGLAV